MSSNKITPTPNFSGRAMKKIEQLVFVVDLEYIKK
jgi:hypothetical protein